MRKEVVLIVGIFVIVLSTVAVIWSYALPELKPVRFPEVVAATIYVGPTRVARTLSSDEISQFNQWLSRMSYGWGPITEQAPTSGDAIIRAQGSDGRSFVMTLWNGTSGADWDKTAVVAMSDGKRDKVRTFSDRKWSMINRFIEPHPFAQTDVP